MTTRVSEGLGGDTDDALFFEPDETGPAEPERVSPTTPRFGDDAAPGSWPARYARWRARAQAHALWLDLGGALMLGVVTLVALLPYLRLQLPMLRGDMGFQGDEGTELYNSDLLRRGWSLYTEAWDFKGPVGYAVFALGYGFADASVSRGRITIMVVLAIWSALAFLCGRAITQRIWPGVLLALFVPLCVWPSWPYAYNEYVAQCLLVAALLAALHSGPRPWLWLVAGALSCLAFWTSLAQGLPGMVSLGVAGIALTWATGGKTRDVAKSFALGVALPSALLLLWLTAHGALRAGLRAMFVFPFAKYQPGNLTEYGFDRAAYVTAWAQRDAFGGLAARVITGATVHTPRVALVLALIIAALLIDRVAHRHYTQTVKAPRRADDLARLVLPAALVAAAVPPLLGQVRADICHLGFIEGSSSFVLVALVARWPPPATRWRRWAGQAFRAGLAVLFAFVVGSAGVFHWRNTHSNFTPGDLDAPTHFSGDLVAARTAPTDHVYILPSGGYSYLYAKRDNALPFTSLEIGDYWSEQWQPSADQVVKTRPRLLLIEQRFFEQLASYRPEIKNMYFGYGGNYILGDRRPGVSFAERSDWELSELSAGKVTKSERVGLAQDGLAARFTATFTGGDVCLAALDQNRISLFRGGASYVGRVSPEGNRIDGTLFRGDLRQAFVAHRVD